MMPYRPDPVALPDSLEQVSPAERNGGHRGNEVIQMLIGVGALLVSAAHARQDVIAQHARDLWQPGIGALIGVLMLTVGVLGFRSGRVTFVRRGAWVAIYERSVRTRTVPIDAVTILVPSTIRTVKLGVLAMILLLVGGVGLPAYLTSSDPRFIYVAWLIAAAILGVAVAIDCVLVRIASATVEVEGIEYTLRRAP